MTLKITLFSKINWSEHPVWHYDTQRSSLNLSHILVHRCPLDIALNTFGFLITLSMSKRLWRSCFVVVIIQTPRQSYDCWLPTESCFFDTAYYKNVDSVIKIYDYFVLLFCCYTDTHKIIRLSADSCSLNIAYYKHLESVIKICYYFDIVVIIQISIRSYDSRSVESPQKGALMVTRWTAIVTLVPYSTAISGAKSIDTQLT